MAFALTSAQFYGVENDEAITNQFTQHARFVITAANTDVDFDFGDLVGGNAWSEMDNTTRGAQALAALKDLCLSRMQNFVSLTGKGIVQYAQADAAIPQVVVINSAAAGGGSATEAYTVTGLLTTDTILAVTQFVDGAGAAVGILSYGNASGNAAADNALSVVYNADPGAGAKVKVAVLRSGVTTVQAGTYQLSLDADGLPNYLFLSGDAPTAYDITLTCQLKEGMNPIEATFEA